MIPPSLTLIVYGVTINESITKLFFAGILPGLVLALMFMAYVAIYSRMSKTWNPKIDPVMTFFRKIRKFPFSYPGSMFNCGRHRVDVFRLCDRNRGSSVRGNRGAYSGRRSGTLTPQTFSASLMGATRTSAMIALILAGAAFLSLSMGFTGLPRGLANLIADFNLTKFELLMVLLVFYIILGMFSGRHLLCCADNGSCRADDPAGRHRPDLVWNFHRGCGRNGTNYTANRV